MCCVLIATAFYYFPSLWSNSKAWKIGLKLSAHPFVLVTERVFLLCCASLYLSAFSLWPANFIHLKDVLAVELNKERRLAAKSYLTFPHSRSETFCLISSPRPFESKCVSESGFLSRRDNFSICGVEFFLQQYYSFNSKTHFK